MIERKGFQEVANRPYQKVMALFPFWSASQENLYPKRLLQVRHDQQSTNRLLEDRPVSIGNHRVLFRSRRFVYAGLQYADGWPGRFKVLIYVKRRSRKPLQVVVWRVVEMTSPDIVRKLWNLPEAIQLEGKWCKVYTMFEMTIGKPTSCFGCPAIWNWKPFSDVNLALWADPEAQRIKITEYLARYRALRLRFGRTYHAGLHLRHPLRFCCWCSTNW